MADGENTKPVADLTLTLDPAEFFGADLSGCPNWPVIHPLDPNPRMVRPGDAEERIEAIRAQLHPGDGPLREPTAEERAKLREQLFTEDRPVGFEHPDETHWRNTHGMANLRPRDPTQLRKLNLIVEACHVWAFIEKGRLQTERAAATKVTADRERAERQLESSVANHAQYLAEYEELREAADRHWQACEDERAFRRVQEIKRQILPAAVSGARQAAETLGIEPPTFPEVA